MKNAIGLFVLTIIVLVLFLPSYTQMQDLQQINLKYGHQIQELEIEQTKLKEELRLLKDDPEYLEKIAREKMGLIREGEVVYKILPPKEEPQKQ